jgi:signal transduction histidine kinase
MGVGLYEAACVVKLHGGTLSYEPRNGGGSEFVIELPIAQETTLSDSVEEATCA